MEVYILYDKRNNEFFWSHNEELKNEKDIFTHITTINEDNTIAIHRCDSISSILNKNESWYDKNKKDQPTKEDYGLPENLDYIVNYYKEDGDGLIRVTDFGVTKKEILDNINNQKYKEGAFYFQKNLLHITNREFITKNYKVQLPGIILPEKLFPTVIRAKTTTMAKDIALETVNKNLQETGIRFRLNGLITVYELDSNNETTLIDEYEVKDMPIGI